MKLNLYQIDAFTDKTFGGNQACVVPLEDWLSDEMLNDGVYTGIHYFNRTDDGRWKIYVVAQDVNYASENMETEDAAKIIGCIVLTNQATVSFTGGTCPLVPDGDVEVIV